MGKHRFAKPEPQINADHEVPDPPEPPEVPPATAVVRWDVRPQGMTSAQLRAELAALGDPRARRVAAASALSAAVEEHARAMREWDGRIAVLRQASETALWAGQRELERVRLVTIELAKADRPADAAAATEPA